MKKHTRELKIYEYLMILISSLLHRNKQEIGKIEAKKLKCLASGAAFEGLIFQNHSGSTKRSIEVMG